MAFRRKTPRRKNKKVARVVERELMKRQEVKRVDSFVDGTGLPDEARGVLVHELTAVVQGDGRSQRDGLQVFAKSLQVKYYLTNADSINFYRVIIFRWHSATTPVITDLIENTASAGMSLVSPYQAEPTARYNILYDKMHKTAAAASNIQVLAKASFKLNYKMRYSGVNAGDGHEGIWFMAYSDSLAASDPTLHLAARFRYTDM